MFSALLSSLPLPHKCTELEDHEGSILVCGGLRREGPLSTPTLTKLTVPLNAATVTTFLLIVDGAGGQLTVDNAPGARRMSDVWAPA